MLDDFLCVFFSVIENDINYNFILSSLEKRKYDFVQFDIYNLFFKSNGVIFIYIDIEKKYIKVFPLFSNSWQVICILFVYT